MYSLFYKDTAAGETEFKFRGLLLNKPTDKFVKIGLENMGWNKENVKLYQYSDAVKFKQFVQWMDSPQRKEKVFVRESDGLLQKVRVIKEAVKITGSIAPDNEHADKVYTQQEIDAWNDNLSVYKNWFDSNTDENGNLVDSPVDPSYNQPWPSIKELDDFLLENEETLVIESLQASLVDINAKIAQEEA